MDVVSPPKTARQVRAWGGGGLLRTSAAAWFVVAALGQAAFVWMILTHYGRWTVAGQPGRWNDKPLIKGYVPGDTAGDLMFGVHVLLAAVVTVGGLLQLVPVIRARAPSIHRWVGRIFFSVSVVMALGGLWLTWVRHTYLSLVSAVAVSVDGVLILACTAMAWRLALRRDFVAHRRWALRAFMVVNGVWFLRVGIMAWVLITRGGIGMNGSLSGPADVAIQFGAYLAPLAALEAYFWAQKSSLRSAGLAAAGLLFLSSALTAVGAAGAVAFMWWKYMW